MAENDFYRVDLVIGVTGDGEVKQKLKATDKFIESTRRRAKLLEKLKVSPTFKLIDRITSPLRRISTSLFSIARRTWSVTIRAKDMVSGTLSRIKSSLFSLPSMLGIGLGGAAMYQGLLKAPLELSGNIQQSQIAFETMLGSAEKAKKMLADLQTFAANTPFEFIGLQESAKQLLAYGFAAEKIIPMMTAVGNAASGLGMSEDGINRITLAIGQMMNKQKVSGEEMLQLTEAGIPAWTILAKKMGMSTAEVMKLSEKGLIPAGKAIDMLIEGMNERFPNMLEKQSKSLFGLWSTIKDTFDNKILLRWGEGLRKAIEPRLNKLVDWFNKNGNKIEEWGAKVEDFAKRAADSVLRFFEDSFKKLNERYFNNPEFMKLDLSGKLEFVTKDVVNSVVNLLVEGVRQALPKIVPIATEIGVGIGKGVLRGAGQAVIDVAKDPTPLGKSMQGPLMPGSSLLDYTLRYYGQKHASGGILTKPHFGLVAEKGPEAIIPLSSRMRSRAIRLWEKTGESLGVVPYAAGGIVGNVPLVSIPTQTAYSNSLNVSMAGMKVTVNVNDLDNEETIMQLGRVLLNSIKKSLENRI